jgi:lipoic acid synthetase
VAEFVHPDRFKAFEEAAYGLGFTSVFSGPLVRSSYHADLVARRPEAR